jgi:TrmH family RNA methyltransferase
MKNWRDNIYFVLVEPTEPGNIGATARAIKNMGFKNLCLVNAPSIETEETAMFAHNAMDILASAETYPTLKEALKDKQYVAGTSRRRGRKRGAFIPVEQGTRQLYELASTNKIAVLFGRESRGLFNEEIEECGFLMTIPANREHPSLNLAQAVVIIAYELSKAENRESSESSGNLLFANPPNLINHKELSHLFDRLEQVLQLLEYIPDDYPSLHTKIMQNLKHCLGRSGLTDWEFGMFQSICKQIENKLGGTKKK